VTESEFGVAEFDPISSGVTNPRVDTDGNVICNSQISIFISRIIHCC
jgi:hypothetical protein